ncbi:MAG: hypothetical protein JST92_20680, partial [Deltaproteobacteria bacterium]|nr:hypothetical protein [Deltaproteobacteria bacterium]
ITGLPSGASVTLQDNAADDTLVNGSGDGSAPISFSFATPIKSGAAYAVTVTGSAGPASCKVASGGSGTIGSGAVTNVALTCVPAYSIGGTISGLSGSGAVLKNNTNGETLALAAGQTSFVFSKFVTTALGYSVSVTAQPSGPTQSCAVSTLTPAYQIGNPTANVTGIAIVCTTSLFSIGGSVTGLSAGTSLIMNDNGGDPRTVSGTSTGATPVNFTFGTTLSSGATYTATIFSVTGNVTCGFAAGTDTGTVGAANVTSIQVQCAPAFTLAGTISGYIGAGLTLLNSTTNERVVVSPGKTTFAFKTPVSAALGYAISAATQPVNPAQTCSPSGGSAASGTPGGNLTDIGFACANNTYSIGGVVNGLAPGTSVTLSNNGDEAVRVSVATAGYPNFVFPTSLTSGQTYTVTVAQQPPGQLCVPRAGTSPGLVGGANVTGVTIDCAPTHTLRGKVRGLTGSGLTITDGLDQLPLAADAGADVPFVFPTPLAKGAAYDLNVLTLPVNPAQTCSVTGGSNGDGSGVMGDTDVTDLLLVCGTPSYKIGGTVLGAATGVSAAMVITNNGGDSLVFAASSTATGDPVAFSMPTPQAPSSTYSIAVLTPPSGLVCLTRNASGVVGNGDVTDVLIVCGYPITGTFDTSVLSGTPGQIPSSGLALQSTVGFETWSDSETLAVAASSTSFTFLDPAPRSGVCGVSVLTNPSRPAMVCTVSAPSGCNGAAIPGPLALKVRCVEQIELVPFTGATGSLQAVSNLGSGEVFAGGAFTGAVDLGHGARTGSAFSALGSGFLQGLDQNGTRGAGASPAGANFDEEFPSRNAAADQGAAIVRASVVTPSGALIIGGNFSGSVDFGDGLGPVAAASSSSMFLARVGVSGGVVWARQFGSGTISELAANGTQIAAGGVYGAAAASSEQFGNVACALTASSAHRDFVATFNETDGACRFAIDLAAGVDANSTTSFRIGPAVAFDSQGNLLTAGVAQDTSGVNALKGSYIATYDATGKTPCIAGGTNNELFFDATTSTNQGITAITAGATDSVIVGGFCRGAPKVHTKATTCNSTASSAALVRYSARTACSSGQLVGTGTGGAPLTFISTGGSAKVLALTADASGNEAALGVYSGTSTWVGTAFFAGAGSESQNLFVARFPAALTAPTVQTLSSTGSVTPSSISLGALGSTWVAGAYNGSLTYRTNPALGSTAASPEPLLVRFPAGPP